MRQALLVLLGSSATLFCAHCQVISPPPTLVLHSGTAPQPEGSTTAMLIVAVSGQLLGGDGIGAAIRVEHQTREDLAVGADLTYGRGKAGTSERDEPNPRHWLAAIRPFAKYASVSRDYVALTAGMGFATMGTGLVSVMPHVGAAVSYPNQYVIPALQVSGAVSIPLRGGSPIDGKVPSTTWFWAADANAVVPIADSGNSLSLNLGFAAGYGKSHGDWGALSVADAQRFGGK